MNQIMKYYKLNELLETLKYYASSQTRLESMQKDLTVFEKKSDFFLDTEYISENTLLRILHEYFATPSKTLIKIQDKFFLLGYRCVFAEDILKIRAEKNQKVPETEQTE